MEEDELIRQSQQGDLESFNALVERYQKEVLNLAVRMLSNIPDAEDATQTAFISAWQGIKRFRGGNFRAWLLRIVANACRDQLRRRKRDVEVPLPDVFQDIAAMSVENEVLSREMVNELQKGLARLPYEQRLAVTLRDINGLSYEEISLVMNCSLGTVRSRLSRGRVCLRNYLINKRFLG